MADVLFSADIEKLEGAKAPNGDGYYFTIGKDVPVGPYDTEQEAADAVTKLLEKSAAEFVKQFLNVE